LKNIERTHKRNSASAVNAAGRDPENRRMKVKLGGNAQRAGCGFARMKSTFTVDNYVIDSAKQRNPWVSGGVERQRGVR